MCTLFVRVYGLFDGAVQHRIRNSFGKGFCDVYDSSRKTGVYSLSMATSDITGTNDYVLLKITGNSFEGCIIELNNQISDGVFENSRVGKYVYVSAFSNDQMESVATIRSIDSDIFDS